jgi:hypothetical protein
MITMIVIWRRSTVSTEGPVVVVARLVTDQLVGTFMSTLWRNPMTIGLIRPGLVETVHLLLVTPEGSVIHQQRVMRIKGGQVV